MAGHRRPRAAIGDLDGDAIVGAAGAQQRQRVLEVAGDAGSDVQRRPRPPGTVFMASPAASVVTTDVISGRSSASASMRSASRASALTALRPRAVSAPACAARPSAPSSATARPCAPRPGRRSRGHTRRPKPPCACGAGRTGGIAQAHLLVGADDQPQLTGRDGGRGTPPSPSPPAPGRPSCRRRRGRSSAPPPPERPLGRRAQREDGVAVSEQGDHASPSPGREMQTLRAG